MTKYVVLSVDSNPDYVYFTPITFWAWAKLGWTPIVMEYHTSSSKAFYLVLDTLINLGYGSHKESYPLGAQVNYYEGYRQATIAQISRLYAGCLIEDGYIMTADIDMLPLSNYWRPDLTKKTVYGFDLTGYKEFPICYLGMPAEQWRDVMRLEVTRDLDKFVKRDLDSMPNAKSEDFYKWWGVDQQLITERLTPYNPVQIKRGQYANGLACGRVDRANWSLDLNVLIDAHLPQQVYHKGREKYFEDMMNLLHFIWPKEDFGWLYDYHMEFKRLTGHA